MEESITSLYDTILKDAMEELTAKKDQVIMDRIKELGIDIDIHEETVARFPKILRVIDSDNNETYYYNDGTRDGARIITFTHAHPTEIRDNTMSLELKYH